MNRTAIDDTQLIYTNFRDEMLGLLSSEEISSLGKIPGVMTKKEGELFYNQDELSYVMSYLALAKSALTQEPDNYKTFRYWARRTIAKAKTKITRDRRLFLLHAMTTCPALEHRNLAHLLITIIEDS